MALNADDATSYILGKIKEVTEGPDWDSYIQAEDLSIILEIFGTAYQEYIENNILIGASWVGVNPSGASDPSVVTIPMNFKFDDWDLTDSSDTDDLVTKISACMGTGTLDPEIGFIYNFRTNNAGVTSAVKVTSYSESKALNGDILKESVILPTLTAFLQVSKPAPASGSHGSFTGTATIVLWS
jgi:hypothetical protein